MSEAVFFIARKKGGNMHPLVDAFYKGRATLKKQQGEFFDNTTKPKKACAVGAIYWGLFKKATISPQSEIVIEYPQFRGWLSKAPCEHDENGGTVIGILIHLNDVHTGHDWPDKKIADWLEQSLASAAV
jgi:hypothetical protein